MEPLVAKIRRGAFSAELCERIMVVSFAERIENIEAFFRNQSNDNCPDIICVGTYLSYRVAEGVVRGWQERYEAIVLATDSHAIAAMGTLSPQYAIPIAKRMIESAEGYIRGLLRNRAGIPESIVCTIEIVSLHLVERMDGTLVAECRDCGLSLPRLRAALVAA